MRAAQGHPLETRTEGWKLYPSLKPGDGECVIRKRESDSFFGTTLQQELEKRGIAHLIVAGAMTEYAWTPLADVRLVSVTTLRSQAMHT